MDPDDPEISCPPGDMPGRIAPRPARGGPASQCRTARPALVRCILDSLALAYRRALRQCSSCPGGRSPVVHVVGRGSCTTCCCELTADACGLPVRAGPAEATALGNILVQARALGAAPGDLAGLRGAGPRRPAAALLRAVR